MSAVPDPAVIAKLANEFFAALPGAAPGTLPGTLPDAVTPPASPTDVDLRGVSGAAPHAAVPDYPRETFSVPGMPNQASIPGGPQMPSSPPTGVLNEADFRAIAASLAGATPLVPQVTSVAPPSTSTASALPGSSSSSLSPDGEKGGPWAAAPQIPPAAEMYSFPGVPAMPASPQSGPPSGSDLAALPASPANSASTGRTDPWAEGPHFAGLNDVFSFPRAPGASVPGIPEVRVSQPGLPEAPSAVGATPTAPPAMPAANVPGPANGVPEPAPQSAIPETGAGSADVEKAVYPGTATKFPSASEVFSFPGVPGAQSPPGVPVLPSSIPAAPSETDLKGASSGAPSAAPSASPSTLADTTSVSSAVPGFQSPTFPGWSGFIPETERKAPAANSLPSGVESSEFRPDLEPAEMGVAKRPLDPRLIRQDFPILQERVNGRQLIWLDNAATTQKPNAVIDRLSYFYQHENSNIHRAAHTLAARATDAYESAREKTRRFLNASSTREIIFVRGTTEGINLIAQSWGRRNVQKDDEVVITWLEHHANIVPWQQLCSEKGARLRVAPVNDRGEVILEEYEKLLGPRTRIVSFSQVSNALGTITPAREMVAMAHRHGARVLVDGAQAVSHMRADVQTLDCDFYVFSGHKVFGPTGIGAVYGKLDVLDAMPPWQGGGNMIVDVSFEKTTYHPAPARFEAGTGNIADAVGLGAALDYVEQVGMESIAAYEHELLVYATAGLLTVPGLRLIGTAHEKAGVMSFVLDDVRTEDVGAALNQEGIAVRSGHHCAQPILRRMGVESTVRPSLALYNTREEIETLIAALHRIQAGRGHRRL
jgi:cysteine desulfurase / selenocysteine lyase